MGTLTGAAPALEGHCQHKLPSSCRLTATLDCCACQDKRPHAPTYNVYVDGIGMVARGTRWQRYCWFCKEFWGTRVALEGFEARDTRVPDEPDQSAFCRRWFDFHRGYRVEGVDEAAREKRVPVPLEREWREVQPGHLPTLEQPEAMLPARRTTQDRQAEPHVSLDETLDSLLNEEEDEEATPRSLDQRLTGRQRQEARQGTARHAPSVNTGPSDVQVREALARVQEAERHHQAMVAQLRTAEQQLRGRRHQHTNLLQAQAQARNMERVWGTQEERAESSWVSPITSMFTRAWDRHRTAEEVRAAERAHNLLMRQQAFGPDAELSVQDMMRISGLNLGDYGAIPANARRTRQEPSDEPQSLDDARVARPPPKTDDEMRITLACRICLQQTADTATLPCGHLVMCQFCAEVAVPTRDGVQPRNRNASCPQCRTGIRRLARIYTA